MPSTAVNSYFGICAFVVLWAHVWEQIKSNFRTINTYTHTRTHILLFFYIQQIKK